MSETDVWMAQVNAYVVRKGAAGLRSAKIENKIALRCVQNADIYLDDCFVPDAARLPGVTSFKVGAASLAWFTHKQDSAELGRAPLCHIPGLQQNLDRTSMLHEGCACSALTWTGAANASHCGTSTETPSIVSWASNGKL